MSYRWPSVVLGDVLKLQRRWLKLDPLRQYVEIGIRSYGRGIFHKAPVTGDSLGNKRVLQVSPGDLVFMNVFAWEGAVAVAGPDEQGTIGSHRFATYTPVNDACDPRYLQLFFQTEAGRGLLGRVSPGSAGRNRTMNLAAFAEQTIPLPPVAEQRRIVARIEQLAGKIAEARRLREEATAATDTLRHCASAAVIDWIRVPNVPLAELLRENTLNGVSKRPANEPPGYPILRISAGTSREDASVDETDIRYADVPEEDVAKYRLQRGDLLACRFNGNLRYVGRFSRYVGRCDEVRLYPDKLIRVRIDEARVLPQFVCLMMNSPKGRQRIEALCATTAGNIGISASQLKAVAVPVPPLPEQRRIVAHLDAVSGKLGALRQLQSASAVELDAILPSILDRAFKGEL